MKKVIIDGTEYESIRAASEERGIPYHKLRRDVSQKLKKEKAKKLKIRQAEHKVLCHCGEELKPSDDPLDWLFFTAKFDYALSNLIVSTLRDIVTIDMNDNSHVWIHDFDVPDHIESKVKRLVSQAITMRETGRSPRNPSLIESLCADINEWKNK